MTSMFLKNANIFQNGFIVSINCEFANISLEEPSCVLVYREYDNPTLNVITYYKQNTSFPVSILLLIILRGRSILLLYLEEMVLLILIKFLLQIN